MSEGGNYAGTLTFDGVKWVLQYAAQGLDVEVLFQSKIDLLNE